MVTYYPTTKESPLGKAAGFSSGYTLSFGTSLAAPEVSAVIAANLSKKSYCYRDLEQIKEDLLNDAKPFLSIEDKIGFGEVRIR